MQDRYARENPDVLERRRKRAEDKCLVEGCENPRYHHAKCKMHHKQLPSQAPEAVNARSREWYAALTGAGEAYTKVSRANRAAKKRGLAATLTEAEVQTLIDTSSQCRYCGDYLTRHNRELDHITPVAKGGNSTLDNVQIICKNCNKAKGHSDEPTFLSWIARLVRHNRG